MLYNVDILYLEDWLKLKYAESMQEARNNLLVDHPYNFRRSRDVENSEHGWFSANDMKVTVWLLGVV